MNALQQRKRTEQQQQLPIIERATICSERITNLQLIDE